MVGGGRVVKMPYKQTIPKAKEQTPYSEKSKKEIIITIEEDDTLGGYMILSQVKGYPSWAESVEGDSGGTTFLSKEEALKFLPEVKKSIKKSNPDAKVIYKK